MNRPEAEMKGNIPLIAGGLLSLAAGLLHLLIIFGGPAWYRFFGAGEGMAILAEQGSTYPTIITALIAITLVLWGCYAFSGAGILPKLPFLKLFLKLIALIYLIRGLAGIPLVLLMDDPYFNELQQRMTFMIITSILSTIVGICYVVGIIKLKEESS